MNWLPVFNINTATIILWLATFTAANLGLVIYIGSKELSSKIWALFSFTMALWLLVLGIDVSIPSQEFSPITKILHSGIPRFTYFLGIIMAVLFYMFCKLFPDKKTLGKKDLFFLIFFSGLFFILMFFTNLIGGESFTWISNSNPVKAEVWTWPPGPLFSVYVIALNSFLLWGSVILYKKMKREVVPLRKKRIQLMFWSILFATIPPTFFDLLLPMLGNEHWLWAGSLSVFVWVALLAYSIMRWNNMNVRLVFAEVLVSGASLLLLLSIFM